MNKKNCWSCECVNWHNALVCIKCKKNLLTPPVKSQAIPVGSTRKYNQNADSDSSSNLFGLYGVIILGIAFLIITFGLSKFVLVDKRSQISLFDQYYYGLMLPKESKLRNSIESSLKKQIEDTRGPQFQKAKVIEKKCFIDTEECYVSSVREQYANVRYNPGEGDLATFRVTSIALKPDSFGNVVYSGAYKATDKNGESFSGQFSLLWFTQAKDWTSN
jgi:hypothetical protein